MHNISKFFRKNPRIIAVLNNYLEIGDDVLKTINNKLGIIFDLDGTLINTENLNYKLYLESLKIMYGLKITKLEWKKFFSGRKPQDSIPNFLNFKGINKSFNIKKFKKIADPIKNKMISKINKKDVFILGAYQFLNKLKKSGKKLSLATSTNKHSVQYLLKHLQIDKYFEVILTGDDVSKSKPHPEIYLRAVKLLKLKKEYCIVFEDSINGIKSALKAGIDVIKIKDR